MKGYTLAELKKKYAEMSKKKGYRGWYEATKKDAGNVPLNNAIFNMMMGSAKSVDMAQVNADNFIGDAPVASSAPVVAADGGIGMAESVKSGTKLREAADSSKIGDIIRELGSVAKLTADDWITLRDDRSLDSIKDDLWMYGNEVRALMEYVFMDGHSYSANEIQQDYRGSLGVSVVRVLKELSEREYSDWKANADAKSAELDDKLEKADPFNPLDEGFNGDEHALIERISGLKEDEVLRLENGHNDIGLDKPLTMCIKKNSKFPGRYILWNETKDGEKLNVVNFSSLDNAVEWAKKTDTFLTECNKVDKK